MNQPQWIKDAEGNEEPEKKQMKSIVIGIDPAEVIDFFEVDLNEIFTSSEVTDDESDIAVVTGISDDQESLEFKLRIPIDKCVDESQLAEIVLSILTEEKDGSIEENYIGDPEVYIESYEILGFKDGEMGMRIEYDIDSFYGIEDDGEEGSPIGETEE